MSNNCYNMISTGQGQNKSGNFSAALETFNTVLQKCDAYDAKEKGFAGKAEALNGLKQFNDALEAANQGLKISNTSIDNLFQKATAEIGLGMESAAKADLNTIISLTQKNKNTAERATIYAKIAALNAKEQAYDEALGNINQAMSLDNSNLDFAVLQGDIYVASGKFKEGLESYDNAISKGRNDAEVWKAKATALIKMNQKKYGTDNAGTLAKKMNSTEKQSLCSTIRTAMERGMKDMNLELMQVAVCN
jgi:tetratricopeptide (TPR) repeat protein